MNEQSRDSFEERTRALFNDSVEGLDFAMRSRLTQARHAAVAAAAAGRRPLLLRWGTWTPAAGVTAAVLVGAFLWLGSPLVHHAATVDAQTNLEDLDIVASADGSSDPLDMLQDDVEFYDWANKAEGSGQAASS